MWGSRFRAAKVRRARASGEYREPTIWMARAAELVRRTSRRATNAPKMMSATVGWVASNRRNSSGGITRLRPSDDARTVR